MNHAYILHDSMRCGSSSSFEDFTPEIEGVTWLRFSLGMLSDDEIAELPEKPTLTLTHPFIRCDCVPDVFGQISAGIFITPKMRSYLEVLEPDVHRYFPIQFRSEMPIGGKTDHGEHFLLLPPPLLDCLVIEETQFSKGFGLSGWKQGAGYLSSSPGSKCTLKKSIVEGHHLWRTKVGDRTEYTCSDAFWDGSDKDKQIWAPHTQCDLK